MLHPGADVPPCYVTGGLCGKLCKIGVKTVDFPFFGRCLRCCFLVIEFCFALQCVFFFVEKGFQTFLIFLSCPLQLKILFLYHPLTTLKSTSVSVCFRGISRLPSAFVFLRWFKFAHISIQVCTFHYGCKQGIDQQIFNRKSISRKITHPQSLFK